MCYVQDQCEYTMAFEISRFVIKGVAESKMTFVILMYFHVLMYLMYSRPLLKAKCKVPAQNV